MSGHRNRLLQRFMSRKVPLAGVLALACAGLVAPSAQAAPANFCPDGSQPISAVDTIESTYTETTQVTGLTVSKGSTPDGFTGTYVGYIQDALGKGKDLLLFKLSSPTIDGTGGLKAAGIWAGMSGSPVYAADGSLIGAVAYSLNADNLPIAGVTPAEYMRNIGTTAVSAPARVRTTSGNLRIAPGMKATSKAAEAVTSATLRQAALVNVANGAASERANKISNGFLATMPNKSKNPAAARFNSRSFQTAGNTANAALPALEPGGNIAVGYSTGDAFAGAIGTVTAVCGDQVWAFGHPMDFAGKTTLSMANADVALVVPDGTGVVGSYKQVSTIGDPVGMISQDRMVGIKGTVGAVTGYPVDLTVTGPDGHGVDARSGTVVNPIVGPEVVTNLVGNTVIQDLDNFNSGTLDLTWTVNYRTPKGKNRTLVNHQVYADHNFVAEGPAIDVGGTVYILSQNGMVNSTITSVSITMKLLSEDAINYNVSGVEYLNGSTWTKLGGKHLKAGKTYSVRPTYDKTVNGDVTESGIVGSTRTLAVPAKGRTSGWLRYTSVTHPDGSGSGCYFDGEELICEDYSEPASPPVKGDTIQDLIDSLASVVGNDQVASKSSVKTSSGKVVRKAKFTGPGYVLGTAQADFRVR